MPGRSLLLGVVNLLFFTALVVVLTAAGERAVSRSGVLEVLALAPALILASGLTLGLAAMSALIGDRLVPQRGPIAQVVVGAAALVLAGLTPFLGWFLFFPYIALVGLGGVVIGLFSRAPEPARIAWARPGRRTSSSLPPAPPQLFPSGCCIAA